jgi:hypothetical protein
MLRFEVMVEHKSSLKGAVYHPKRTDIYPINLTRLALFEVRLSSTKFIKLIAKIRAM